MLKQTALGIAALVLTLAPGHAQTPGFQRPMPPEFEWSSDQIIIRARIAADLATGGLPTPYVLTSMVTWISNVTRLPANYDHPQIKRRVTTDADAMTTYGTHFASRKGVTSSYDDATTTIYLPPEWNGASAEDISILVHEMTHHLQNRAGLTFDCTQEREKLAYVAQAEWLKAASSASLRSTFGIDAETLLFATECYLP